MQLVYNDEGVFYLDADLQNLHTLVNICKDIIHLGCRILTQCLFTHINYEKQNNSVYQCLLIEGNMIDFDGK